MTEGPSIVITTARLVLRPYCLDDFDDMHALMSRPETFRFPRRDPLGQEECWSRLLRHIGHWRTLGYGFLAVRERDGERFVGEAGLSRFRRDTDPAVADLPEATWSITPEAQGQGHATEAAAAAHDWAQRALGLTHTACMIDPANSQSLRVAAKLGYRKCARVIHKDHPTIVFERRRPELKA